MRPLMFDNYISQRIFCDRGRLYKNFASNGSEIQKFKIQNSFGQISSHICCKLVMLSYTTDSESIIQTITFKTEIKFF